VCATMRKEIEEFSAYLPLVESLYDRESFTVRHWNEMFGKMRRDIYDLTTTGDGELVSYMDMIQRNEVTLYLVIDWGFMDYLDELTTMASNAQKAALLNQALNAMKRSWEHRILELQKMEDSETSSDSKTKKKEASKKKKAGGKKDDGGSVKTMVVGLDSLEELLDDHLAKTQSMRGISNAKEWEVSRGNWEMKLLYTAQCLEQMSRLQKNYMSLILIFCSPASVVNLKLQMEAQVFQRVETEWRQFIARAETEKVMPLFRVEETISGAERGNMHLDPQKAVLIRFRKMNEDSEHILLAANEALKARSLDFPRFFFLSNEELIFYISTYSSVSRHKINVSKIFQGIDKLHYREELIFPDNKGPGSHLSSPQSPGSRKSNWHGICNLKNSQLNFR